VARRHHPARRANGRRSATHLGVTGGLATSPATKRRGPAVLECA
jgi:hypothetical protein